MDDERSVRDEAGTGQVEETQTTFQRGYAEGYRQAQEDAVAPDAAPETEARDDATAATPGASSGMAQVSAEGIGGGGEYETSG